MNRVEAAGIFDTPVWLGSRIRPKGVQVTQSVSALALYCHSHECNDGTISASARPSCDTDAGECACG